ncbi:zinc-ribbon domain-containing protein, partial [Klebsiella pneumoniae]|nr:zinc-ribbon domain-containing protein [Klebsiella pneumoniae]
LKPENILAGTNQKVHWKCQKCKAKWSTKVAKRTKEGSGCPSCSRKVDDKEEALVNKYPSLMKEWDYKKNKKIDPTHYHY